MTSRIDWSGASAPRAGPGTGRTAVVTGGGRGIGAALSRRLAGLGAHVVVVDIDLHAATAVATEIGGTVVQCDVASLDDNVRAARTALDATGPLDLVVLNAGLIPWVSHDAFDEAAYRRGVGVNLDGVVFGIQAYLPHVAVGGSMVAVGSIAGLAEVPFDPLYGATKAAVISYVRSLAPLLLERDIRLNSVCPTYADTPLIDQIRDSVVASGLVVVDVEAVVDGIIAAASSPEAGQAWLVQAGRTPAPFRYPGLPGPLKD